MLKKVFLYLIVIGGFISLIWLVTQQGNKIERSHLPKPAHVVNMSMFVDKSKPVDLGAKGEIFHQLVANIKYPLSILLLQVILILIVSKVFGLLFKRMGQQTVIGEIIAGIFLGPSLMGWLFPDFSTFLFPHSSFVSLQFLSQIGLAFFMFVIGMELDIKKIKNETDDAVIRSSYARERQFQKNTYG